MYLKEIKLKMKLTYCRGTTHKKFVVCVCREEIRMDKNYSQTNIKYIFTVWCSTHFPEMGFNPMRNNNNHGISDWFISSTRFGIAYTFQDPQIVPSLLKNIFVIAAWLSLPFTNTRLRNVC